MIPNWLIEEELREWAGSSVIYPCRAEFILRNIRIIFAFSSIHRHGDGTGIESFFVNHNNHGILHIQCHGIDLIFLQYYGISTRMVNSLFMFEAVLPIPVQSVSMTLSGKYHQLVCLLAWTFLIFAWGMISGVRQGGYFVQDYFCKYEQIQWLCDCDVRIFILVASWTEMGWKFRAHISPCPLENYIVLSWNSV